MYLSFYGLKIKPFQNSTHPSFFWLGEKQQEALAIFKYGISKMPGILLLTGDVGTGKTMLVNALLNSLGDQFIVVKVLDPDMDGIEFMNYIADALDFKKKFASKDTFFAHFSHFLETSATLGKKVILVIDECQRLNSRLLNEILKLANIEKAETKLLKVILIGQNDFNDVLQKNKSSALYKFIAINYAIAPLDLNETDAFIRHRLKIAGAQRDIFSSDAISRIHEISGGIPRRINIICDHALLFGFAQETTTINGTLIDDCAKDLRPRDYLHPPDNEPPKSGAGGEFKKIRRRLPESKQKVAAHRAGKTFGMVALITITIFLITYFTAPMTYRKALDYIYNQGLQVFNNLQGINTQNSTLTSAPAIQKTNSEDTADKDIATTSETTVTKEHQTDTQPVKRLPGDNVQPAGEQQQKIAADAQPPETAGTPSRTDDLPAVVPIDTIKKDVAVESVAPSLKTPLAEKEMTGPPDASEEVQPAGEQQQGIAADGPPETAGTSSRTDDLPAVVPIDTIKKDVAVESVAPSLKTPLAEKEMTAVPDTPETPASKEIRTEIKDLLDRQNASQVDSTPDKQTNQKKQDDLTANAKIPDEPANKQEVLDETPPEPIDPAAIIDWVIKNKGK